MLKRDYLIKQIEEFGKALSMILSHKREQNYDKFEQEISLALKKYSDGNLEELENITLKEFESKIIGSDTLDFTQKKIMATVLFEKMLYYSEKSRKEESGNLKNKCVLLYQHIQTNSTDNEYDLDVHYKLSYLNNTSQGIN